MFNHPSQSWVIKLNIINITLKNYFQAESINNNCDEKKFAKKEINYEKIKDISTKLYNPENPNFVGNLTNQSSQKEIIQENLLKNDDFESKKMIQKIKEILTPFSNYQKELNVRFF